MAKRYWKGGEREREREREREILSVKAAQEKLDESIERWEEISNRHHGLLPPVMISKRSIWCVRKSDSPWLLR